MTPVTPNWPALRVCHLSKTVVQPNGKALRILQDIDLELAVGETVAIIGASGSGKSTLLSLLAGLDTASGGDIHVFGHPLHQYDEDARAGVRAQHLGFVFQSYQLLAHLTALENVILPLELGVGDAQVADPRQRGRDLLKQLGLGERVNHLPGTLSGGEQQRVALARAFVSDGRLILADEPTGSLDKATGEDVMQILFELARERGASLLLVTHDERLAQRCDRCLVLEDGCLRDARATGA